MTKLNKSYTELITIPTFIERYRYLKLNGMVGEETFGYERYLNQRFYTSKEWRQFRRDIIIRDMGGDLGIAEHPISGIIIIHHINPIAKEDILPGRWYVLMNPDNVICVSDRTHKAIHYGDESLLMIGPTERRPNDTCPWRR